MVALLNLSYFAVEFAVALSIGSVALFADSVDFLEDSSVNLLILLALGWAAPRRARVGMLMAGLLLVPAAAALWTASSKFHSLAVPAPAPLTLTAFGALLVNLYAASLLARFRTKGGSLTRAAFLSARNDAAANIAIMVAGALTFWLRSAWPDLLIGIGIALMNVGAAKEVWEAAHLEKREAEAELAAKAHA